MQEYAARVDHVGQQSPCRVLGQQASPRFGAGRVPGSSRLGDCGPCGIDQQRVRQACVGQRPGQSVDAGWPLLR